MKLIATAPGRFRHSRKSSMVVVIPTENIRSPKRPVKYSDFTQVKEAGCFKAAMAAIASQTANKLQNVVLNFLIVLSLSSSASPALRIKRLFLLRAKAAVAKPKSATSDGTIAFRSPLASWASLAARAVLAVLGEDNDKKDICWPAKMPWEALGTGVTTMKATSCRRITSPAATAGKTNDLLLMATTSWVLGSLTLSSWSRSSCRRSKRYSKKNISICLDVGFFIYVFSVCHWLEGSSTTFEPFSSLDLGPRHPKAPHTLHEGREAAVGLGWPIILGTVQALSFCFPNIHEARPSFFSMISCFDYDHVSAGTISHLFVGIVLGCENSSHQGHPLAIAQPWDMSGQKSLRGLQALKSNYLESTKLRFKTIQNHESSRIFWLMSFCGFRKRKAYHWMARSPAQRHPPNAVGSYSAPCKRAGVGHRMFPKKPKW